MTRSQTSFLDLVGGCCIFSGKQWGVGQCWCHGGGWWWLQKRAMRRASSVPQRLLTATEEVVSVATRHRRDKSQIGTCGWDDYSQRRHVSPYMPSLFVFLLPRHSAICVECWLSCTSYLYILPPLHFSLVVALDCRGEAFRLKFHFVDRWNSGD